MTGEYMRHSWIICLTICLTLAGCSAAPDTGMRCLLATEAPSLSVTLYFGRAIAGRAPVSDQEWSGFVQSDLAPRFPDGFTVTDTTGQWRNPATGIAEHEQTKVVQAVLKPGDDDAARIGMVSDAYRRLFHQDAVGVVTNTVCAAF